MKIKQTKIPALAAVLLLAGAAFAALPSDISVDLKLDDISFVAGERMRGVVSLRNMSPVKLSGGGTNTQDRLFIEVFRASDYHQIEPFGSRAYVASFDLAPNEGQRLETYIGDHYELLEPRRYLARPVLVHAGQRYVGGYSAFDIVPGMKITGALQVFTNREGLSREFSLLHWSRKGKEHLFLAAVDHGSSERRWLTHDIGPMMRITKPTISIMPDGIVVVFHRNGADSFVRSEFWSLPDALEFHSRQSVLDPETAGQTRGQQMYKAAGGVKPADRPWWKFW